MFIELDTQELVELGHKIVSASLATMQVYGRDSELNKELLEVLDDFENSASDHNIVW